MNKTEIPKLQTIQRNPITGSLTLDDWGRILSNEKFFLKLEPAMVINGQNRGSYQASSSRATIPPGFCSKKSLLVN